MAYATIANVRNRLFHMLVDEDIIGEVPAGTYIELNNPAFDVPTITKDGAELVKDTDFTFVRPYSITLGTAASGEKYIATVYIGAPDSVLESRLAEADRFITDYFAKQSLPGTDYLNDWSSLLAAAYFLRLDATATEENVTRADAMEKQALTAMDNYKINTGYDTEKRYPRRTYVYKVNR